MDSAFKDYFNQESLSNFTFLYEILFKSHRVSNQILFDNYLNDGQTTYYTDSLLPVSTIYSSNGEIFIQIGHVRGKIIQNLRNLLCLSGIIHVIDSVLNIPTKTAYDQIAIMPELTLFKKLIDKSPKMSKLFQQSGYIKTQILNRRAKIKHGV